MLQGEITPFAKAHTDAVQEILDEIEKHFRHPSSHPVTNDQLMRWQKTLTLTQRGFERFRVCAEDEWRMKEKLIEARRNCRLNHQ
jgi:hypothetical protein